MGSHYSLNNHSPQELFFHSNVYDSLLYICWCLSYLHYSSTSYPWAGNFITKYNSIKIKSKLYSLLMLNVIKIFPNHKSKLGLLFLQNDGFSTLVITHRKLGTVLYLHFFQLLYLENFYLILLHIFYKNLSSKPAHLAFSY